MKQGEWEGEEGGFLLDVFVRERGTFIFQSFFLCFLFLDWGGLFLLSCFMAIKQSSLQSS